MRKMNRADITIGKALKKLREAKGWDQPTLANAVGIESRELDEMEVGGKRVPAGELFRLASVLGVPLATFFRDFPDLAELD